MAEVKINGRDILISLDIAGNGDFKPVACLTTNNLNTERAAIDANSKCGDSMQPGDIVTQTIEGTGYAINETGTPSKESYASLYNLMLNKTIVDAQFGPADPVSGDTYFYGPVTVTTLNITAEDGQLVTFDVTLTPTTPPLQMLDY